MVHRRAYIVLCTILISKNGQLLKQKLTMDTIQPPTVVTPPVVKHFYWILRLTGMSYVSFGSDNSIIFKLMSFCYKSFITLCSFSYLIAAVVLILTIYFESTQALNMRLSYFEDMSWSIWITIIHVAYFILSWKGHFDTKCLSTEVNEGIKTSIGFLLPLMFLIFAKVAASGTMYSDVLQTNSDNTSHITFGEVLAYLYPFSLYQYILCLVSIIY